MTARRVQLLVEKTNKGYYIKAKDAATGKINDAVYAILLEEPEAEDWVITPQPQHGASVYMYVYSSYYSL